MISILKIIEHHKTIAAHLEEAAKRHREVAKHQEEGDYNEAANSADQAYHHTTLAAEAQTELLKHFPFTS